MQADQLSALSAIGGLVGSGVAFVALCVSVWAVFIARRNAGSAQQQADVAKKTYRITAKPDITVRMMAGRQDDDDFTAIFTIERSSGPPELMYRYGYSAFLDTDVPGPSVRADHPMSEWLHLDEGREIAHPVRFTVDPPYASAQFLSVVVEIEMIEPSGVDDETAIPWRRQEWIEWLSPDIVPYRSSG